MLAYSYSPGAHTGLSAKGPMISVLISFSILVVMLPAPGALLLLSTAEYCYQPVCLSVCAGLSASILSLELLDRSLRNFVWRSPVAVAPSSSGGVALRYVLRVLWMTSCLAVLGGMALGGVAGLICQATYVRDRGGACCHVNAGYYGYYQQATNWLRLSWHQNVRSVHHHFSMLW